MAKLEYNMAELEYNMANINLQSFFRHIKYKIWDMISMKGTKQLSY